MSIYRRWMLVILVAFAQLVAFLAIHLWTADSSLRAHAELLVRKSQSENQIVSDAAMYRILRLEREDRQDQHRLQIELAGVDLPANCGLAVFNANSGKTFCNIAPGSRNVHGGNNRKADNTDPVWDWSIAKTESGSNSRPLLEEINSSAKDIFQCCAGSGDTSRVISTRRIPRSDLMLVVYCDKNDLVGKTFDRSFYSARNIGFALILFIGLGCCGLMLSLLTRYGDKVTEISGQLEKLVEQRTGEISQTQNAVIFGLAKLAESRDNDTGDHLDRIRLYVTILAQDLASQHPEIDSLFINNLELASSLHDIGKVGIPDSILLKPGRLSSEERDVMEIHTVIGGECLDAIEARLGKNEFMVMAREVAYSHHERWDGTGYPHGLAGERIPLVARVVSVADVYDALTSKRPYKRAMSHMESRRIIVEGSGTQFDPQVVQAFLRHEDEFLEISIEQQTLTDEDTIAPIQKLSIAASDSKPNLLIPQSTN